MCEISTSILTVKKEEAIKTFYNLEVAKTDYFHIDVMDGIFVENNNLVLMKDYALSLKHITTLPLDIHLMVEDVKTCIDEFIELEPHTITFHAEAIKSKEERLEIINTIKQNNIKVGIAINPKTKIEDIYDLLPYVHTVLVMTVEPGKGGQKLIPETLLKIKKLAKYIEENNLSVDIEADGGINIENIKSVKDAGANIIVVGTYIINSENYTECIKKLKEE